MTIRWAEPAAQDLEDIARHLAADSRTAASTFVDRVQEAVDRLTSHPEAGRIVPELERHNITQYREVVLTPWRLFYRYERRTVFVLAIFDGRRNIQDTLLRRLTRTGAGESNLD